jgi:hypothetical protein
MRRALADIGLMKGRFDIDDANTLVRTSVAGNSITNGSTYLKKSPNGTCRGEAFLTGPFWLERSRIMGVHVG